MIDQPIYVTAYHQSPFGKLKELTVPEIVELAVTGRRQRSRRRAAVASGWSVARGQAGRGGLSRLPPTSGLRLRHHRPSMSWP
jgi:hypothetical protein